MSTLPEFAERVEELLADTKRDPHWDAQQAAGYMAEVELRHKHFSEPVTQLIEEAIHPRVKLLSGYFSNT